jgi:hypothetical protein
LKRFTVYSKPVFNNSSMGKMFTFPPFKRDQFRHSQLPYRSNASHTLENYPGSLLIRLVFMGERSEN